MKKLLYFIAIFLAFVIILASKGTKTPNLEPIATPQLNQIPIQPEPPEPSPIINVPKIVPKTNPLIEAHNTIRQSKGLKTLKEDSQLMDMAQKWANHMAKTHIMRHQSLKMTGNWNSMGENIAMGQGNINEVMNDWMNSRGHRANILGNYTHIGVGVAKGRNGTLFWCVDFGKK